MLRTQGDPDPAGFEASSLAFAEYTAYMTPIIADRRRTGRTDDLIGILTNAEIDGDRLTDDDLIFETLLILIGGDETTRHVLSGAMLELQRHPDQLAALQSDRCAMPAAVEEMPNRDAEIFADPFGFDIARNPNPHLAFGVGGHFCLGNQLARLELSTMFDRIFDRLPDLRLSDDGPVAKNRSNFVCGLRSLPVEFTPTGTGRLRTSSG